MKIIFEREENRGEKALKKSADDPKNSCFRANEGKRETLPLGIRGVPR